MHRFCDVMYNTPSWIAINAGVFNERICKTRSSKTLGFMNIWFLTKSTNSAPFRATGQTNQSRRQTLLAGCTPSGSIIRNLTRCTSQLILVQIFPSRRATISCLWQDPANFCYCGGTVWQHDRRTLVPIVSWAAPAYAPVGTLRATEAAIVSPCRSTCQHHFP